MEKDVSVLYDDIKSFLNQSGLKFGTSHGSRSENKPGYYERWVRNNFDVLFCQISTADKRHIISFHDKVVDEKIPNDGTELSKKQKQIREIFDMVDLAYIIERKRSQGDLQFPGLNFWINLRDFLTQNDLSSKKLESDGNKEVFVVFDKSGKELIYKDNEKTDYTYLKFDGIVVENIDDEKFLDFIFPKNTSSNKSKEKDIALDEFTKELLLQLVKTNGVKVIAPCVLSDDSDVGDYRLVAQDGKILCQLLINKKEFRLLAGERTIAVCHIPNDDVEHLADINLENFGIMIHAQYEKSRLSNMPRIAKIREMYQPSIH